MTDRELMEKAWDYLASYTVGERPNASEVNDLIFALESRLTQPETPYPAFTEREELAENPLNAAEPLPTGKAMADRDLFQQALESLQYASDETKPEGLHGCDCLICKTISALKDRLKEKNHE